MLSNRPADSPPRRVDLVVLLVGAGVLWRLTGLGHQSLWYDEAATVHVATATDWLGALRGDRHPPVSFLAFRAWAAAFGHGDATLRLLPALCSCAALALFAGTARRLVASENAARLAIALYAFSPFLIWHAQEVRMYPFVELGSVLALRGATALLDGVAHSRAAALATLCGTAIASGSHYLGALSAGVVAVFATASPGPIGRRAAVAGLGLGGFALWTPFLVSVLPDQLATPWGHQGELDLRTLAELPARMFLVESANLPGPGNALMAVPAVAIAWALGSQAVGCLHRDADPRERRTMFALGAAVIAAATPGLFGVLNFAPKYLTTIAPLCLSAVAAGILSLRPRAMRVPVVAALFITAHTLLVHHRTTSIREDYRAACAELEEAFREGDAVAAVSGTPEGFSQAPLRHYLRHREDILAAIVPVDVVLDDPSRVVGGGNQLHVVHRTAPYADPLLDRLRGRLERERAGTMRNRIVYLGLRAGASPGDDVNPRTGTGGTRR
ncbi:MAG: glycosyltransferase family 39 protein [Planctomycetota bacterium]|nr:glycosyltransferase family 39 protein [Planctomycetota bacterium]